MNTLEISNNTWYNKLFMFVDEWWAHVFFKQGERVARRQNIDLCSYLRVLFVKLPIMVVFYAAILGIVVYSFIVFPFITTSWLLHITVIVVLFSLAGLVFSIFLIQEIVAPKLKNVYGSLTENIEKKIGFFALLESFYKDRIKEKICPMIKIVNEKE